MEDQTEILDSFVANVSAKRRRTLISFYLVLFICLVIGLFTLYRSIVEIRKKQELAQLEAQIAGRRAEKAELEKEIADLRRSLKQARESIPPEFNKSETTQLPLEPTALVKEFKGDNRLLASNQLIQLYDRNKSEVVGALVNAIQPDEMPTSYRVDLYVAFTLARIDPIWEGKKEQLKKIEGLRNSRNYKDETFKKWVDQASKKFRETSG